MLFLAANVTKKIAAKIMSGHFNQASHYEKMQDSLRKVNLLDWGA